MIIGIDLDEVLADFSKNFIAFYSDTNKTSYKMDEMYSYDLSEVWKETPEKIKRSIYDFYDSQYFENIRPISGSIEGVDILSQKYELQIITSRQNDIKEKTENWIEKYFPNKFSQITLTNHFAINGASTKKSKICLNENIDIMIEDAIKHALDCTSCCIKVLLLDYPWNRSIESSKKITRVRSWNEIVKNIE
ncbi:hypothetical protein KAK05_00155 [Candidatus Parcubacteria bacterium]|nr:hypothetical protein [Candidatus Parcubacteria bacterium]